MMHAPVAYEALYLIEIVDKAKFKGKIVSQFHKRWKGSKAIVEWIQEL